MARRKALPLRACEFDRDATAIVDVDERHVLPLEHVARVHRARGRDDHPGVAVRVASTEVVQRDSVATCAERGRVFEGPLRQEATCSWCQDVPVDLPLIGQSPAIIPRVILERA